MTKKERQLKNIIKEVILIVFSFFIGALAMLLAIRYLPIVNDLFNSGNTQVITKNGTHVYEKSSLAPAVEKAYDAVLVIQPYNNGTLTGTGTGFVYKTDDKYGYVLTNEHVVSDGKDVKVVLTNDEEVAAEVLGKDEYLDLAVLRIDKKSVTQVVTTASSQKMNIGDTIFTIGSPLGYNYRGSVTSGILSGKDRLVSMSVSKSVSNDWVMKVLQIDASINPGNSGGPLLNVNGEVIGICSMKLVDDNIEGMGFAIPIEYALSHVDNLEKGKKIEWPVLGIGMVNVTDTTNLMQNNLDIDTSIKEGVVVHSIKEGTGAAKSDLKKGDIIIKINDTKVKDIAYLKYELYQHQAGDTIEITYIRNKHEKKTKVKLGSSD